MVVPARTAIPTSRVWLLLDVGREMTGSCPSGEPAYEVAANALRMFAALSLRRSDDVSLVFGDAASITRVPFQRRIHPVRAHARPGVAALMGTGRATSMRCWDYARRIRTVRR